MKGMLRAELIGGKRELESRCSVRQRLKSCVSSFVIRAAFGTALFSRPIWDTFTLLTLSFFVPFPPWFSATVRYPLKSASESVRSDGADPTDLKRRLRDMSHTPPTRDTTTGNGFTAEAPSRASNTGIPKFLIMPLDVSRVPYKNSYSEIVDDAFLICENETWTGTVGKYKEDDETDPWVRVYLGYETSETPSGRWGKSSIIEPKTTEHVFLSAAPMSGVRQRGQHEGSKFRQTRLEDYSCVLVPYAQVQLKCCSPGIEPEETGFSCIAPQPEKGSRESISREDRKHQHSLWLKCVPKTEGQRHVKLPGSGHVRFYNSPEADELGVEMYYEDGKGPGEMGYESDGQSCEDATPSDGSSRPPIQSGTQIGRRRTRYL